MKSTKFKSLVVAAAMALASVTASAAVNVSGDLNPSASSEFYAYSSVGSIAGSFSDYISLSLTGTRELLAGIGGASTGGISFTAFDLVAPDHTTVLSSGTFSNLGPKLAFGGLEGLSTAGNYFIHIAGISSGVGGYAGFISSVSPVPEPEIYGMLLAGLGLIGFVARRRKLR